MRNPENAAGEHRPCRRAARLLERAASVFAVHDVPLDRGFRRSLLTEWLPLAAALTD